MYIVIHSITTCIYKLHYTNYNFFIHSDELFISSSTLYKLHLVRVCPGCRQTEHTLGRLRLGSMLGPATYVLAPVWGTMLVQLTWLCPTYLHLEQTCWRRLSLSLTKRILVVLSQPACLSQIGGLTTKNLMDSGTSHSSRWQTW